MIDIEMSFGDFAMLVLPGKVQKGNNGGKGGVTNAAVAENIKKPDMNLLQS